MTLAWIVATALVAFPLGWLFARRGGSLKGEIRRRMAYDPVARAFGGRPDGFAVPPPLPRSLAAFPEAREACALQHETYAALLRGDMRRAAELHKATETQVERALAVIDRHVEGGKP